MRQAAAINILRMTSRTRTQCKTFEDSFIVLLNQGPRICAFTPKAFRYAGFLLNRFRVVEKMGKASFEPATGHGYSGKRALLGKSDVQETGQIQCKRYL